MDKRRLPIYVAIPIWLVGLTFTMISHFNRPLTQTIGVKHEFNATVLEVKILIEPYSSTEMFRIFPSNVTVIVSLESRNPSGYSECIELHVLSKKDYEIMVKVMIIKAY